MFFIGIFGVEDKQKEIKKVRSVCCKGCNENILTLVKEFSFFHIFFIPLFKWNEKYFLICNNCNAIYEISKEKGMGMEHGEDIEITYWDLKYMEQVYHEGYAQLKCKNCGKAIESNFEFCPYCGEKRK